MTDAPLSFVPVPVRPGDVLVIAGTSGTSKLIEAGAVLEGEPAASHVAVYHHTDKTGRRWAIEGRPGGVGWADAGAYLRDPRTLTNAVQPKTPNQRQGVCAVMVKLLGTSYDWLGGIAADAAVALHLPVDWAENDPATGTLPGAVVCSSAAAYAYDENRLANPGLKAGTAGPGMYRRITPGDWSLFLAQAAWQRGS